MKGTVHFLEELSREEQRTRTNAVMGSVQRAAGLRGQNRREGWEAGREDREGIRALFMQVP